MRKPRIQPSKGHDTLGGGGNGGGGGDGPSKCAAESAGHVMGSMSGQETQDRGCDGAAEDHGVAAAVDTGAADDAAAAETQAATVKEARVEKRLYEKAVKNVRPGRNVVPVLDCDPDASDQI